MNNKPRPGIVHRRVHKRRRVKRAAADFTMITGAQIRAARVFLNWTAAELSQNSGVSISSILRAENSDRPSNTEVIVAIKSTLEKAGIDFFEASGTECCGPGLRLRKLNYSAG
jgi:transcriptional regulator with XRE-family HTH domain